MPPTETDIRAEGERRAKEITDMRLIPGPNGNQKEITEEIAQMAAGLADEMKSEVAQNSQMYINADALDIYPNILGTTSPPSPVAIYFSQVGLWVQRDVFTALAAANSNASGVMQSPVKHLVKIDVNEEAGHSGAASGGGGWSGGTPAFAGGGDVPVPDAGAVRAATPTGRSSNATYEVIPFKLVINVDARAVPQVMTEMSRNRFITILTCNITAVDSGTQLLAGYYYGAVPVVQLEMDCEILLLKSWLSKLMPPQLNPPPQPVG
jgi:hypothetical protein